MKVTHRIAMSTGLLLTLLAGVLVYNLVQLRRLFELQEAVTRIDLSATTSSLEMTRLLDELERTTKKLLVSRDPDYAERLVAIRSAFDAELERLTALPLRPEPRLAADQLTERWNEMPVAALSTMVLGGELDRAAENELTEAVDDWSEELRAQAEAIGSATQRTMSAEAAAAVEAGQRAATVSKVTMVVVVTISLPLLLFTLASIREPLARLRAGTRSVTAGAFDVEVATEGNDEFSGVAASFNEMVRRLGELDRLKREFLSHVSHELKAPLAAMQETNRALLDEVPGTLNAKQKRLLVLNLESSDRLSAMIGKLLDLARLEEGALEYDLKATDLGELADEVSDSFAAAASEKNVTVEVVAPPASVVALCDRDRIIQVIGNLVENAIKFSPEGASVVMTASAAVGSDRSEKRQRAVLQISDRGPGVPEEQKEKVFERFFQGAEPETSSGGVGLGLAICREIVTAHQGAVWVEDNPGGGSVFCLSLPAATERPAVGRRAAAS